MMTQQEFFQLSIPEQVKLIKESGMPLTVIGNNADIFQLFNFYVIVEENEAGKVIQVKGAQATGLQTKSVLTGSNIRKILVIKKGGDGSGKEAGTF